MAYAERLYAQAYGLADADARASQEHDAFRHLLHTPLTSDADRLAYAQAVIGRAAGSYGSECQGRERSDWMPTAYRNLVYGEHAHEADSSPSAGSTLPPAPAPQQTVEASGVLVAMLEAWQAMRCAINDEIYTDQGAKALCERYTEMQIAICRFPATTVADLLVKVPVFQDEMRDAVAGVADGYDPADTLSGAAWLGLFRDFERLSTGTTERSEPVGNDCRLAAGAVAAFACSLTKDAPAGIGTALHEVRMNSGGSEEICIAIENHREALRLGEEEHDLSDEVFQRHIERQTATDDVLRTTRCQSLADLRAKLTYLVPIMAPDMLDRTHVEHLNAIRADADHLCRRHIALTAAADDSDLASSCIQQVERLSLWDANPGTLSEEESDAEMDRCVAVFKRAIVEPSPDPRTLAAKAALMLDDLNRFHPAENYKTDDFRLMRVILFEVIAQGTLIGSTAGSSDAQGL